MSESDTIRTLDVLVDLGFKPRTDRWPGLMFEFGDFTLYTTGESRNPKFPFQEIVLFTGVWVTPRKVTSIEFLMPIQVVSREQCVAWITWHLDVAADGTVYTPASPVDWLAEGRKHYSLLPWVVERLKRLREREEYDARPQCTTQREWMKLALKTLAEHLANLPDIEPVDVGFDGKVLSFRVAGYLVVLAAEGTPWPSQFTLPAGKLRWLPKRLMSAWVGVSVWRSHLYIERYRYDGIVEKT
jgi:hypothetical protein